MTLDDLNHHLANRRSVSIRGRYRSDPAEVIRVVRGRRCIGWGLYTVLFWGADGWDEENEVLETEIRAWLERGSARVVPPDLGAIEEAQALERAQDDDARRHL